MKSTNQPIPGIERLPFDSDIELRSLIVADSSELFQVVDSNREHLEPFLPWVSVTKDVVDSEYFIRITRHERVIGNGRYFGVFKQANLVGHISLMHIVDPDKLPEIGFWLVKDLIGQGITPAIAGRMTQFGLEELELDQILIRADTSNYGSNRVAEKLGYELVKTAEDPGYGNRLTNHWVIRGDQSEVDLGKH